MSNEKWYYINISNGGHNTFEPFLEQFMDNSVQEKEGHLNQMPLERLSQPISCLFGKPQNDLDWCAPVLGI